MRKRAEQWMSESLELPSWSPEKVESHGLSPGPRRLWAKIWLGSVALACLVGTRLSLQGRLACRSMGRWLAEPKNFWVLLTKTGYETGRKEKERSKRKVTLGYLSVWLRGTEHVGVSYLESRHAWALKCANGLGEGVTRAKPIMGKPRVKQKKGNNENWRVLSL